MTITEIYSAFIAGKSLPALTSRTCRQLLDLARNAILTKGKEPKFSVSPGTATDEKQNLIAAGDQLRQLGIASPDSIYAGPAPTVAGDPHWTVDRVEALLATTRATLAKAPTAAAKPAAKPAAKQDLIADVQREFAKAKELDRQENIKRTPAPAKALPPPTSITSAAYDPCKLAAQAAAQIAKRPKPAAVPAPAPRPMKNLDLGHLRAIASRPGFKAADKAQALTEMALRGWTRTDSCWTKSGKA